MDSPAGQLQRAREQARTRLGDGYALDLIDQDTLDERLEAVERAASVAEIDALTADLRPAATTALVPTAAALAVPAAPTRLRVLFSSVDRTGAWHVAARTHVRVVFGNATLDLRQAVLPGGPIELDVNVVFGNLDIIIPPGWQLDNECGAILGSVEQLSGPPPPGKPRQLLRVRGRVVFSSLTIHERLPGENAWGARKRRKREHKALAQRSARALPAGDD
ncbi:LiaF-related protein [Nannocystis pusilla]|uniref:LiaF-related protein n=1 Tax=Nannocystis pusilla TaxID=889268 RepID=A0A9X3J0R1_9BACT|nr:LiaF-related protein [Nannocystis pusilla]